MMAILFNKPKQLVDLIVGQKTTHVHISSSMSPISIDLEQATENGQYANEPTCMRRR